MYMLQDRGGQMLLSGPVQPCSHLDLRHLSSRPGSPGNKSASVHTSDLSCSLVGKPWPTVCQLQGQLTTASVTAQASCQQTMQLRVKFPGLLWSPHHLAAFSESSLPGSFHYGHMEHPPTLPSYPCSPTPKASCSPNSLPGLDAPLPAALLTPTALPPPLPTPHRLPG